MNDQNPAPEVDSWESEATGGPAPAKGGSFFTFWRCCGCLVVLGLVVMIGVGVAFKLGLDAVFEVTPMEMPTVEFSQTEVEEIKERFEPGLDSGETFEITPEELTILVNSGLQGPGAQLGPESRFFCGATPDGLLDLRISIQMPDGESATFFTPAGRFMNLQLIGQFEIQDGDVTEAQISRFRLGKLMDKADFTEADSVELIRSLDQQKNMNPDLRDSLGRVEVFKFDGEKIQLRFRPEGNASTEPGPSDPAVESPPGEEPVTPEAPAGDGTEAPKPGGG